MNDTKIEKLRGLYKVYYEVQQNYPNKQKLLDIGWEAELINYEQMVVESVTTYEYYSILMKYISLVNDGHTTIMPPWMINPPGFSKPAIELQMIEGKAVISRVGNVRDLSQYNIVTGDVITHVDGVPVQDSLNDLNTMYARGSKQANEKINSYFLLLGDTTKKVKVKLERLKEHVELVRSIQEDDGSYFIDRFLDFDNPLQIDKLENEIYYINILSFSDMSIADLIIEVLSQNPKGVIIDVRLNLGGNDLIANKIISHLIKEPALSPIWRCKFKSQAFDLWGKETTYEDIQNTIEPAGDNSYENPIIILTSGMTSSTAEDMVITLKHAKRATIIGSTSAGSSGNPKNMKLPFGGTLRVSSFIPFTPNRKAYLGLGIEPDIECVDTIESLGENRDKAIEIAVALIKSNRS